MSISSVFRVLSLDGGGIRGIMTAVWLNALEGELGCNASTPLHKYFDLVAGTSTGSILAAAVGAGIPAKEIISIYRDRGGKIFPRGASLWMSRLGRTFSQGISAPKYAPEGLYKELQNVFKDRRFGDAAIPTLMVSYDTLARTPVVFKSHAPDGTKSDWANTPVWKACAASSSAPTYFPAFVMDLPPAYGGDKRPLIDGGVVANNPTACAMAEAARRIREIPATPKDVLVASFGTGQATRPITAKEAVEWGALEWAIPVIDVLFDGSADAVDYIARNMLPTEKYFRFQTDLRKGFDDMDDASESNLSVLVQEATDYILSAEQKMRVKALAKALKGG